MGYTQNQEKGEEDYTSSFNFGIAPQIGYAVSDKWDVGAYVGYTYTQDKIFEAKDDVDVDFRHGVSLTPYTRYYFADAKKWRFYFEGLLSFAYAADGSHVVLGDADDKDHDNTFTFGLNVVPGVSYDINEHFSLELGLSFLRLGYSLSDNWTDEDDHELTHNFNAIFNSNNILGSLGQVTVGMLYKF